MSDKEKNSEASMSGARFAGYLIRGTEGRPIRNMDLPESIDFTGLLFNKMVTLWAAAARDPRKREHSFLGVTRFAAPGIHFEKNPVPGEIDHVMRNARDSEVKALALGMHTHTVMDAPFSPEDISSIMLGRTMAQAEMVINKVVYLLIVQTAETPQFINQAEAQQRVESILLPAMILLQEQWDEELRSIEQTAQNARLFLNTVRKHNRERKEGYLNLIIQICDELHLGFYSSLHAPVLTRVRTLSDLQEYLDQSDSVMDIDLDREKRKLKREADPENFTIFPEHLSEEQFQAIITEFEGFLAYGTEEGFFTTNLTDVFVTYCQARSEQISMKEFVSRMLFLGDHDLKEVTAQKSDAVLGLTRLLVELGILSKEE